jgi:hypothetical protein
MRIASWLFLICFGLSPLAAHAQALDVKKMMNVTSGAAPKSDTAITPMTPAPAAQSTATASTVAAGARSYISSPPFVETLPIEVALMYAKLNKEEPNFDFLVFANPAFRSDKRKFGDAESIKKERILLETIYKDMALDRTVFHAEKTLDIITPFTDSTAIRTRGIEPFDPVVYEMTASDAYGVFIRNARDTLKLKVPFETGSIGTFMEMDQKELAGLPVELTLRPLAVDREGYLTDSNRMLKVLIADVVEIKIYNKDKEKLLLQKRFKNWQPYVPPKEDETFKTDNLIPAPATP